jgi:hypothetical protein
MTTTTLYVVFADHAFDSVSESIKSAVLHMIDLQEMGIDSVQAMVIEAPTHNEAWRVANEIEDMSNAGKPVGRKFMKRIETDSEWSIKMSLAGIKGLTRQALGE